MLAAGYSESYARDRGSEMRKRGNLEKRIIELSKERDLAFHDSTFVNISKELKGELLSIFKGNIDAVSGAIERCAWEILQNRADNIGFIFNKSRYIDSESRYATLMRAGFMCQACGDSPKKNEDTVLHIDHIIPFSLGGTSNIDNLQVLCQACNISKSNNFIYNHNVNECG